MVEDLPLLSLGKNFDKAISMLLWSYPSSAFLDPDNWESCFRLSVSKIAKSASADSLLSSLSLCSHSVSPRLLLLSFYAIRCLSLESVTAPPAVSEAKFLNSLIASFYSEILSKLSFDYFFPLNLSWSGFSILLILILVFKVLPGDLCLRNSCRSWIPGRASFDEI